MRIGPCARWQFLPVALLGVVLGSCRSSAPPKLLPLHGTVTFRQQPVKGATVCLIPDITQGNRQGLQATGQTGADGTFSLQTYPHGDGAMPGYYKITCTVLGPASIPPKYASLVDTPLRVIVKEGNDHVVLTLDD